MPCALYVGNLTIRLCFPPQPSSFCPRCNRIENPWLFPTKPFCLKACRVSKGNLHSHTTNSDGHWTPEQAVQEFRAHGYQFLCLSEHDLYTDYSSQFDRDDFIILPGLEASAVLIADDGTGARLRTHHMHGILGTDEMIAAASEHFAHMERLEPIVCRGSWDGRAVAQELADTLAAHGCAVTYNHPIWSRIEPIRISIGPHGRIWH